LESGSRMRWLAGSGENWARAGAAQRESTARIEGAEGIRNSWAQE
jgi:hypothetical protein